ncbi:hypothetical protein LJC63_12455, partial [Ruminococcaceae bacterium OttesenSCG-928-L11]|nr:hypothetical protein [Ruminococcaceae bacterium OttesenSCG-928-L11]
MTPLTIPKSLRVYQPDSERNRAAKPVKTTTDFAGAVTHALHPPANRPFHPFIPSPGKAGDSIHWVLAPLQSQPAILLPPMAAFLRTHILPRKMAPTPSSRHCRHLPIYNKPEA